MSIGETKFTIENEHSREREDKKAQENIQKKVKETPSFGIPDKTQNTWNTREPLNNDNDKVAHELFVGLHVLEEGTSPGDVHWSERSRWINNFEQHKEEGVDIWSKPNPTSLNLKSLLHLNILLNNGVYLFDIDDSDLHDIACQIVDALITHKQIKPQHIQNTISIILKQNRHVEERTLMRRVSSVLGINPDRSLCATWKAGDENPKVKLSEKAGANVDDLNVLTDGCEVPKLQDNVIKKIPEGAEAATVMVGKVDFLDRPVVVMVRLFQSQPLNNVIGVDLPIRFMFLLLGPKDDEMNYYEVGRAMSTLFANKIFVDVAYRTHNRDDLLEKVGQFYGDSIVLAPGDWDRKALTPVLDMARKTAKERKLSEGVIDQDTEGSQDQLKRSGHPFGGMINDIRNRYPWYWSDIKDGFNMLCLASFFFVYFAEFTPSITLAGLLSEKTDRYMGVSEMLVSCFVFGTLFSLLSAQPLILAGFTPALLVFEEGLFQFCGLLELEFLPFRFWVSVWITVIAVIVVLLEGSVLVKFITRFTTEIFSLLLSVTFLYEAFLKLYAIFKRHPLAETYYPPNTTNPLSSQLAWNNESSQSIASSNETQAEQNDVLTGQPNTALLSLILMFCTFILANILKNFRTSYYLGKTARKMIGDFGIPIAISIMVMVDFAIKPTYTEKLFVPDGLTPTASEKRGWFVWPLGQDNNLPPWAIFAAIGPGFLIFILIFMETVMNELMMIKKERKLKKGSGFHLDLFLLGIFAVGCGAFGLPFLSCATLRCVAHVGSVTEYSHPKIMGERPKLVEVKEQRLTNFAVHIMFGISLFMGPALRFIPLSVLFGVFLYMGTSSMDGVQMVDRTKLLFVPTKHHPSVGYVQKVPTYKMHLFTLIEWLCLGILWAVKSTKANVAFPFFLIMTVPLRHILLPKGYSQTELKELDNKGIEDNNTREDDLHED